MKIQVNAVASYKGHNVGNNGQIRLKMAMGYDEIVNAIELLQFLGNNIDVKTRLQGDVKGSKIGSFTLHHVAIDHDGESTITLLSMTDYVEIQNINDLIQQKFKVRFEADIENEEEDD